jgi:hypothetical protein
MAIGNREAYAEVAKSTTRILQTLRDFVRPDLADENRITDTQDINQQLIEAWKKRFGDPEAAERQVQQQKQHGEQQSAQNEDPKSKIRSAEDYIRSRLFR